jgi:two-component system chemotaxis response regulator CheB
VSHPPSPTGADASKRDIVVIGGSAGCLDALKILLSALPRDLAAAILIVVHTSRSRPGALAHVLGRATALPVRFPRDRDRLRHGQVFVALPDYHMIVEGVEVRNGHGPRESGFRPAIDPLFRTAAENFRSRVVGVILSGALDDGTSGLAVVKNAGGFAVVQSPDEAVFASMPLSALQSVDVDAILPVEKIAALLVEHAGFGRSGEVSGPRVAFPRTDAAEEGRAALRDDTLRGPPSPYTCPECGGALWEVRRDQALGFRCHVGHAYGDASFIGRARPPDGWAAPRKPSERPTRSAGS